MKKEAKSEMEKEVRKIMNEILCWTIIGAKIKLADAKEQVVVHEKFIKHLEEAKEKMEVLKCLKKKQNMKSTVF